jgi:hypothetical protein
VHAGKQFGRGCRVFGPALAAQALDGITAQARRVDAERVLAVADDDAVAERAAQEAERLAQVGRRAFRRCSGQNAASRRSRGHAPCIDSIASIASRQRRRGCASSEPRRCPSAATASSAPSSVSRITPGSRSPETMRAAAGSAA